MFGYSQSLWIIHEEPLSSRALLFSQVCLVVGDGFGWWGIDVFKSVGVVEVVLGAHEHLDWLKINSDRVHMLITAQGVVVGLILGQIFVLSSYLN